MHQDITDLDQEFSDLLAAEAIYVILGVHDLDQQVDATLMQYRQCELLPLARRSKRAPAC